MTYCKSLHECCAWRLNLRYNPILSSSSINHHRRHVRSPSLFKGCAFVRRKVIYLRLPIEFFWLNKSYPGGLYLHYIIRFVVYVSGIFLTIACRLIMVSNKQLNFPKRSALKNAKIQRCYCMLSIFVLN